MPKKKGLSKSGKSIPVSKLKWNNQVFESKAAMSGGVVRRAIPSVERYGDDSFLKAEIKSRRYRLYINRDTYVILCNSEDLEPVI